MVVFVRFVLSSFPSLYYFRVLAAMNRDVAARFVGCFLAYATIAQYVARVSAMSALRDRARPSAA